MKKLFVGKLAFSTTETALREFFAAYAPLNSVKIVNDSYTGKSRGFGFVEIEDSAKAAEAVSALNGRKLDDANIVVNEARPRESRGSSENGNDRRNGALDRERSYGDRY